MKVLTFKRGEQFDYTNAHLVWPEPTKDPNEGWSFGMAPVKREGYPVDCTYAHFEGQVKLGDWWSIQLRIKHLVIRFRYRSWTSNIFYIAWDK